MDNTWTPAEDIYIHTFTVEECRALVDSVTPDTNFRKSSPALGKVKRLATDMTNGTYRWRDADPIRLDTFTSGPSNGLHRIRAAVYANQPLTAVVMVGAGWRAGEHTDRDVKPRQVHEILTARGITNSNKKAAAARWIEARRLGRELKITRSQAADIHTTQDIVIDFVLAHDDALQERLHRMPKAWFGVMPSAWTGALMELEMAGWSDVADVMQAAPSDFDTLDPTDPFAKLLASCRQAKKGSGGRSVQKDVLSAGIRKAAAMYISGEQPEIWRWPRNAAERSCDWILEPLEEDEDGEEAA